MKNLKTAVLVCFIFCLFFLPLWILGPRDKKSSPYKGGGFINFKKEGSLYKKIIRGKTGDLDTLFIITDSEDSLYKEIPYSRKIKFILDTTRDNKKIILISPQTGNKIKFLLKKPLNLSLWRGLYKKEFRWIKQY